MDVHDEGVRDSLKVGFNKKFKKTTILRENFGLGSVRIVRHALGGGQRFVTSNTKKKIL